MEIRNFLDSTYLKTPEQAKISEEQTWQQVLELTNEAIEYKIFAVMIRPNYVAKVKKYLQEQNTAVKVGTVIGFHEGTYPIAEKIIVAQQAINDGADELDFVVNYQAYSSGNTDLVEKEILECTQLCLDHDKIAKWIIEIAALTNEQIAALTKLIADLVSTNFPGKEEMVFVKSSTGFYKTEEGKPNGATFEGITIMLQNSGKLQVKAAGGVRTHEDAVKMINLGVKRIGTSAAKDLIKGQTADNNY